MAASVPADLSNPLLDGLRITMSEQGAQTTLALDGEWDLAQQGATRHAIRTALTRQPARLVLDLSRVTFIDSSGIHVIIDLVKRAARLKIGLVIVPGTPAVQRIFDICQLTARLPFSDNV
jgi:anti-sigma B factor antagonist